jgi:hypothetical protein
MGMKKAFKYTDNRFLSKFNNGGRFGKLSIYLGFWQDRATRYERLILAVVSAWAEGQIEEVLDLHFQVPIFRCHFDPFPRTWCCFS